MLRRFSHGARSGALVGTVLFAGDVVGAFLGIGFMFVPTRDSIFLLAAPFVASALVAAGAGGLITLLPWRPPGRRFRWLALAAVFVVAAVVGTVARIGRRHASTGATAPTAQSHGGAPVLWVVVDTLRADATYGDGLDFPHAPGLRELSREAVTFTEAESTAGWTVPSMVAILTGVHHTTAGASTSRLPGWATTVAEVLHAAGYETRAVVDNPIMDPRNGFAQGFQSYVQRSSYRFVFSMPGFRWLPDDVREWLRFNLRTSYLGAPGLTDEAVRTIESAGDRPLFLLVHYMDPHAPYYRHDAPDPPDSAPIAFWRARDRVRTDPGNDPPTAAQMRRLRHRYAGEIRHVDAAVDRLVAAWHRRYGRTGVIAVTADHGEEFLEHGRLSHSNNVHRESVHVPLLLQLPNHEHDGSQVDVPVNHLDLVPTTLEAARVRPSGDTRAMLQGQSWLGLLEGRAEPAPILVANHGRHGRDTKRARQGPWVIVRSDYYDGRPSEVGLFDLRHDPGEQHDVSGAHPELAASLGRELDERLHFFASARDPAAPPEKEDEAALRALGYVR